MRKTNEWREVPMGRAIDESAKSSHCRMLIKACEAIMVGKCNLSK